MAPQQRQRARLGCTNPEPQLPRAGARCTQQRTKANHTTKSAAVASRGRAACAKCAHQTGTRGVCLGCAREGCLCTNELPNGAAGCGTTNGPNSGPQPLTQRAQGTNGAHMSLGGTHLTTPCPTPCPSCRKPDREQAGRWDTDRCVCMCVYKGCMRAPMTCGDEKHAGTKAGGSAAPFMI